LTIYTAKWSNFFEKLGVYENLPVFKASYDLLLNIYQFTGKFTREYKYTVGEKIRNHFIHHPLFHTLFSPFIQKVLK